MLLGVPHCFHIPNMLASQQEKITYSGLFINGLPPQELVPNMRILCINFCIIAGSYPVYPNLRKLEIEGYGQFVLPESNKVPNLNVLRIFKTENINSQIISSYNNLQVLYTDRSSFENMLLPKTEELPLLEIFDVIDDFTYITRNKRPIYIKTDRTRVLLLNLLERNYIRESYIIKEIMRKGATPYP
jgi:hypothetical protein